MKRAIQKSFLFILLVSACPAFAATVEISTAHPGGNAVILENGGSKIRLKPDLRGGRDWFYWNFEATVTEPGEVKFVFEGNLRIGVRGPAVSKDNGKTWRWLGTDTVRYFDPKKDDPKAPAESFRFTFPEKDRDVRFAVAIPYQKRDLDEFLGNAASNPNFHRSELTKSRGGKSVDLVQIGEAGKIPVIVTARHHCCESMASYVLEGFLTEAMSDSAAANAFRERYVIYAVPMMDSDGVEAGDQGKWRFPHDHNRDYGDGAIYPEVKALMELAREVKPKIALDFHCPSLRGDTHEVFYFIGIGLPHLKDNTEELLGWIGEECPQVFPRGPHNFMRDPPETTPTALNSTKFSVWFAYFKDVVYAATFEIPYSQRSFDFDADMAREYGRSVLRASEKTKFVSDPETRKEGGFAELEAFRKKFGDTYKSKPNDAEAMAGEFSQNPAEAGNAMGLLRLRQRKFEEADHDFRTVLENPLATAKQRLLAATQIVLAAARNPDSTAEIVTAAIHQFEQFPTPSPPAQFEAFGAVADFFLGAKSDLQALEFAGKQLEFANNYQKGASLNRVADLLEKSGQVEEGLKTRKEAVTHLRGQLEPEVPVGIFGVMMARDLFDALTRIPDSTSEEIQSAAEIVFRHKVASEKTKSEVRAALKELITQ